MQTFQAQILSFNLNHLSMTQHPLSVVIPTLGGCVLAETIQTLNIGPAIPAEILICIPEGSAAPMEKVWPSNVRVIETPCRGQVAQRAYGFALAGQPLVMQLDDDISLQPDDLDRLVKALCRIGRGHAIAPIYRDPVSERCLHAYREGVMGWLQNVYALLVCDAPWGARRMGVLSAAGVGYGVDEKYCATDLTETQWLPGGCVVCFREDLLRDNFFPFSGKAYCEDLIHSILRRKRDLRMWVLSSAHCTTPAACMPFDWSSLKGEIRARRYVVGLTGGSLWRLTFWCVIDVLKRVLVYATGRIAPAGRLYPKQP